MTKETMNETRLEWIETLSPTEHIKSCLNGTKLKGNETKGMPNEVRLQHRNFPKISSLVYAWLTSSQGLPVL